jgi:hypothetical protein
VEDAMKDGRIFLRESTETKARWTAAAAERDQTLGDFIRHAVEQRIVDIEAERLLFFGDGESATLEESPQPSPLWIPVDAGFSGPPGQGAVVNPQQVKPCSRFFLHTPGFKCQECGQ